MNKNIIVPKDKIAEFCRRYHIRKLALFGSVLREDFGPESGLPLVVSLSNPHSLGYHHK